MTDSGHLPQLDGGVFLTDAGLETDLIFHHGVDLPEFASFVLCGDPETEGLLRNYFRGYLDIGATFGHGLVLETPTWRANSAWGELLGYDASRLRDVNRQAVDLLVDLRARADDVAVVISGCIGPRGDAYADLCSMDPDGAAEYHQPQVAALADAGADLVSALTLTNGPEAVGVVRAAAACGIPAVISFTVETDGRLPTGVELGDAIAAVDAATDGAATYFMVNCAHPDHFVDALASGHPSLSRLRGVRANASRRSHAELDQSEELDDGDPVEFGTLLAGLHRRMPHISVLGGCCGSDERHIEAIARAVAA